MYVCAGFTRAGFTRACATLACYLLAAAKVRPAVPFRLHFENYCAAQPSDCIGFHDLLVACTPCAPSVRWNGVVSE